MKIIAFGLAKMPYTAFFFPSRRPLLEMHKIYIFARLFSLFLLLKCINTGFASGWIFFS